jgi:tellurite resistance protein TerC
VIAVVLAVVTVASLVKTRRDPSAKAHPGSLRARRARDRHRTADRER